MGAQWERSRDAVEPGTLDDPGAGELLCGVVEERERNRERQRARKDSDGRFLNCTASLSLVFLNLSWPVSCLVLLAIYLAGPAG